MKKKEDGVIESMKMCDLFLELQREDFNAFIVILTLIRDFNRNSAWNSCLGL